MTRCGGNVKYKSYRTPSRLAWPDVQPSRPGGPFSGPAPRRPRPLLLPNPWDAGSAKLLASLGFQALATTSGGFAGTLGRLDGSVTRDEAIAHAAAIVAAVDLPVSADLENCFADDPEGVARTVGLAMGAGLAGCSVEDYQPGSAEPIYPLDLARDRVAAAASMAHAGPVHLVITARAENFLHGRPDLADTHRPPAGLPGGWRRRAVRARPHPSGGHPGCRVERRPPGQRARPPWRPTGRGPGRGRSGPRLGRVGLRPRGAWPRWKTPPSSCATPAPTASPPSRGGERRPPGGCSAEPVPMRTIPTG